MLGKLTKKEVLENDLIGERYKYKEGLTDEEILIANVDYESYHLPWNDDTRLSQYGTCRNCDTKLVSWAKRVVCPNCGNKRIPLT